MVTRHGRPPMSRDSDLADDISRFYADPYKFVMWAYPWGEPGPLAGLTGPDTWQADMLHAIGDGVKRRKFNGRKPVAPIRVAAASGHGVGKSTLVAWLVGWIMSTRPDAQGTITANTYQQLRSKTWASIQRWMGMSINAHWWNVTSDRVENRTKRSSWFCTAQTCREENSEAFAGQHAAGSTSFYIFDEASAVPDKIYEVAEGGLTDGEPMIFLFGNPTRSSGKFHRAAFGSERTRWHAVSVDSRDSALTNKAQIEEWRQDYGEDSDFFRVRVKGLPPSASDAQFIGSDVVYQAQSRAPVSLPDDPLVCGLDISRGGSDNCVFRFRRGLDGASIPAIRIPGEQAKDSMRVVSTASDVLTRQLDGARVAHLFVDETGIGGPIVDRLRQLGHRNMTGVQFGGKAPEYRYANMRAYMWARMRSWLERGAIDRDSILEGDLTGPGYHHNRLDQLVLESKEDCKKRGLASPDDGDALALTFASAVAPLQVLPRRSAEFEYAGSWMS